MKLLPGEMVRADGAAPLELFAQGVRAEATRAKYTQVLRKVTCEFFEDILEGSFEERVAELVARSRDDPEWARDLLISLSRKLRERTALPRDDKNYLNPATVPNTFKPVKKLFDMNDIVVSWRRIYATFPELDNLPDTAGWSRRDISQMLLHARDTQDRAMILVLASSGVRAGALPELNWGDIATIYRSDAGLTLEPAGDISCGMVEVYRGSPEQYTTFITPEALRALSEYGVAWEGVVGRPASPVDPVFLALRGGTARASGVNLEKRVYGMAARAGLRGNKTGRTYRVPLFNGFRRFHNKASKESIPHDSPLASLIKREYMMGHRGLVPLDKNYYKTTPLELAAEYMTAVPNLTISDEERLLLSNRALGGRVGEAEAEIARLRRELGRRELEIARLQNEARRGNRSPGLWGARPAAGPVHG